MNIVDLAQTSINCLLLSCLRSIHYLMTIANSVDFDQTERMRWSYMLYDCLSFGEVNMGRVKRKSVFKFTQIVQIQIILR